MIPLIGATTAEGIFDTDGPFTEAADLFLAGYVCAVCDRPAPPDELVANDVDGEWLCFDCR